MDGHNIDATQPGNEEERGPRPVQRSAQSMTPSGARTIIFDEGYRAFARFVAVDPDRAMLQQPSPAGNHMESQDGYAGSQGSRPEQQWTYQTAPRRPQIQIILDQEDIDRIDQEDRSAEAGGMVPGQNDLEGPMPAITAPENIFEIWEHEGDADDDLGVDCGKIPGSPEDPSGRLKRGTPPIPVNPGSSSPGVFFHALYSLFSVRYCRYLGSPELEAMSW